MKIYNRIPLECDDRIVGVAGTQGYRYIVVTKDGYVYNLMECGDNSFELVKSKLKELEKYEEI